MNRITNSTKIEWSTRPYNTMTKTELKKIEMKNENEIRVERRKQNKSKARCHDILSTFLFAVTFDSDGDAQWKLYATLDLRFFDRFVKCMQINESTPLNDYPWKLLTIQIFGQT